ncbi:MAG: HdeD family acid-resistance protein [Gammaproteobacteria bacterium]
MNNDNETVDNVEKVKAGDGMPLPLKEVFGDLGKNWGWLMALGILFVVLGVIALGMPVAMTLTTVVFFAVLLFAGGIFQIIDAFKCKGWKGTVWHVLIGLLYIVAAGVIFNNPALGSLTLTAMLGAIFIAIGLLRIVMSLQLKQQSGGWGWLLFAGIVSILLGAAILLKWPATGLVVIGVLVAIEMIIHGWSYVFMALAARKAHRIIANTGA